MADQITDAKIREVLEYCEKATLPGVFAEYARTELPTFASDLLEARQEIEDLQNCGQPNRELSCGNCIECLHRQRVKADARVAELTAQRNAEKRDHGLTISTFRQQERIWNQKFKELKAEIQSLHNYEMGIEQ